MRKTFVVGLASLAMLAVPALPASADARVIVEHENVALPVRVFGDPDYCASYGLTFHVVEHETVVLTSWEDADGNTFRVFVHHDVAFDLSANGKNVARVRPLQQLVHPDPQLRPAAVDCGYGRNESHIRGDDGIVLLDAGRIVEDAAGKVTFHRGPHPQFLGGTFCSALLH
jgi:hypothetical protein